MDLDFNLYWQKIKNNEESALEKIYKAAYKYLVNYARAITGNVQMAEEVVQDVFLKIWQNRSEISIKVSFKAYLLHSIHNNALNVIRQQKTLKESVNILRPANTWQFISDTYDINDDLIERIFMDETETIIDHAIADLPEQCRKVFCLSRYESLRNEEIAVRLGLAENTVKSHIYNALQKIAFALKKEA